MKAVTVVGMGDEGCPGLSSIAANAVAKAQILAGGKRHLDFFPQFSGEKIVFKDDLTQTIKRIAELSLEHTICVLASGDPLFFGIGNLIRKKVGPEYVDFIPAPSSVQHAFAKIGIPWDDAEVLSLHGRSSKGLITKLQFLNKVALFTDKINHPKEIASYLLSFNESEWTAFVCENLGGEKERIRKFDLKSLSEEEGIDPLNVLILIRNSANWKPPTVVPNVSEENYSKRVPKKGLITKKEVRILSIAFLNIREDSVIWDIGAGSGSIAIEAAQIAKNGKSYAIEIDPEGIEICKQNILLQKTDNVHVISGKAPEVLEKLPDPDCIFVGGSNGDIYEIIRISLNKLSPLGSLVINAVTIDNVSQIYQSFKKLKLVPEVTLLNVSRGRVLKDYLRYEALNPIHIFKIKKPEKM
ncbi:precorrin-6y C5,15-methyltransferase (decarboxylating), CbiE subunit / precorrin-6Y C5,15-methyltransferase (decarboxylating), CbiT subunit multi-domain protein [Leptospira interrogans serovar Hebdomadis str. R499]|uniref:Bifunctional cobalt-precorrin-7 (C(5))-methyltransferase/cobalt-precorrin-6B (C(15))-methyltransferase n=1 Tax=Leptospira interrogans serovar Canicola TaxID=211880 RepID=A0AAQ0B016_LEPIR|nr:bifunctional cobalt-precorrin-7 (C(5))-methyltransferase/cobalt-precorrin-6B (C(15))-methyltransferase [Leptospira interrogans]EKR19558.1 precorrin-6y C5,15-methyltransferase (decarboxylating), CbiE subunit / precorrin-6Y C5,15-methyltransferase (decarboxylating), CbiT subunit multi-domain protein [Leptospira interrogans serovar Pyrogenes str. 2006006960]EKR33888.1 precorrin-6y C5,15-methyltransferase (decarboxylating), CbiE subunit / precorrin-6Y C5,15-methyltransferase (decarboxylating), Cbi